MIKFILMKLILIQPNFIPNLFILNFQLNNSELGTAQPQLVFLYNLTSHLASHRTSYSPKIAVTSYFATSYINYFKSAFDWIKEKTSWGWAVPSSELLSWKLTIDKLGMKLGFNKINFIKMDFIKIISLIIKIKVI